MSELWEDKILIEIKILLNVHLLYNISCNIESKQWNVTQNGECQAAQAQLIDSNI